MKRTMTGTCAAVVLGFAVSLSAQPPTSTTPAPTTPQRPMSSDRSASKDITVTGCLAKGTDGGFMLTNARVDSGAMASTNPGATTTTGTTGTTGTTPTSPAGGTSPIAAAANSTWWLSGSSSDLEKHVGHKIQVTGSADTSSASSHMPGSTTTTATPPSSTMPSETSKDKDKSDRKLDVQSVKMIAASCS